MSCEQTQSDTELRDLRRQPGIDRQQAQSVGCLQIRAEGVLGNGHGDSAHDQHGQHGHLQARAGERMRIDGQQAERGEAGRIEAAPRAKQQPGQEVKGHHPERALHWLTKPGQHGVRQRAGDGNGRCPAARHAHARRHGKDETGEDGQVHAGDNQQMKRPGAFKADARLVFQVGAVAEQHGAQHAGVRCVQQ